MDPTACVSRTSVADFEDLRNRSYSRVGFLMNGLGVGEGTESVHFSWAQSPKIICLICTSLYVYVYTYVRFLETRCRAQTA